jgi:Zinc carboxypeptidase
VKSAQFSIFLLKSQHPGTNLERNFDVTWENDFNSSPDPCSDNFRGSEPSSEESVRLIKFFMSATHRLQEAYVSLQSGVPNTFNGHIGYPYSFSK